MTPCSLLIRPTGSQKHIFSDRVYLPYYDVTFHHTLPSWHRHENLFSDILFVLALINRWRWKQVPKLTLNYPESKTMCHNDTTSQCYSIHIVHRQEHDSVPGIYVMRMRRISWWITCCYIWKHWNSKTITNSRTLVPTTVDTPRTAPDTPTP